MARLSFTRRQLLRAAAAGIAGDIVLGQRNAGGAAPELCRGDVAIDATTALLFPASAPLMPAEGRRDARAVWARVPPRHDSRVLLYLHGYDNYVTVDVLGRSRVPDWAGDDSAARTGAASKPAAPLAYGLDRLEARQTGKAPLVLVPEDAVLAHGTFWARTPAGQYQDPGRLQTLITDSFAHLSCLRRPDGRPYLTSPPAHLRRLCLCGHSGAGLPLQEAAGAALALPASGVPTDLWLFDCTYWSDVANFVQFCARWHSVGRLAAGQADAARFVCVYRPRTQTEAVADILRVEIANVVGEAPETLVKDHTPENFGSTLRPALKSGDVLFVRTFLPHDEIPTFFIPRLLETAAS